MRVLVTGHTGYIGSVLTERLIGVGHDVTGLDTGYFAECLLGPATREMPSIHMDLRDVTVEQLRGFDAVVHLAALCNDPLGNLNPDLTYDVNHRSSVRLAAAAKDAGVTRFLFSSSCSLYGSGLADLPPDLRPFLDERAEFLITNPAYRDEIGKSLSDIGVVADILIA